MQPDVELARLPAVEQPQSHQLEVLLQPGRYPDGLRRSARDQEISRVPGEARVLHPLEPLRAAEQRVDRSPAALRLEHLQQRQAAGEQADDVARLALGETMPGRVEIELRSVVRVRRHAVAREQRL